MKQETQTREYTIDASGKKLGRIASEVATILLGKDKPDFKRNVTAPVKVKVTNVSKLDINVKKLENKEYKRYTGYPSGLKSETMEEVIKKKGYKEIFRKAVYGMIPSNKLRSKRLKNLIISE